MASIRGTNWSLIVAVLRQFVHDTDPGAGVDGGLPSPRTHSNSTT